jgi:threonine synthase
MDIQVSSNFERLLHDLNGCDGAALEAQMRGFEGSGAMRLTNTQREGASALFASNRADAEAMAGAMRWAAESCGEIIDPHTAVGLHAARVAEGLDPAIPIVTLATAHPAKFPEAVMQAVSQQSPLPTRLGALFEREERCAELPGDYAAVVAYVLAHACPRKP